MVSKRTAGSYNSRMGGLRLAAEFRDMDLGVMFSVGIRNIMCLFDLPSLSGGQIS